MARLWCWWQRWEAVLALCCNAVGTLILLFYVGEPYVAGPDYWGLKSLWWWRVGAGLNLTGFAIRLISAVMERLGRQRPPTPPEEELA
jgi:Na+/glutamate symporter